MYNISQLSIYIHHFYHQSPLKKPNLSSSLFATKARMIFGAAVKAREALPNGAPRRRRPKAGESGKRTRRPNAWRKGSLVRESSQNPLISGLGIILYYFDLICPEVIWLIVGLGRWFGILGVHPSNKPFHVRGFQESKPPGPKPTIKPLADLASNKKNKTLCFLKPFGS